MQIEDDDDLPQSWADILAARSLEGKAVVEELYQAEKAVLKIQDLIFAAVEKRLDFTSEFQAMEAAMKEVDSLRKKVYRMAHQ